MRNDRLRLKTFIIVMLFPTLILASTKSGKGFSVTQPLQVMARGQAKRLLIIGFNGTITMHPSRADQISLKIIKSSDGEDPTINSNTLNQVAVQVLNLGDAFEVRSQPPSILSGPELIRWTQSSHSPEVKLDITAPPQMNLEIYLTRGDVHISQWKAPVFISSHDGHLVVDDVVGDVSVRSMLGSVKAEKIRGTLAIESYSSLVNIDDVTGKIKVRNFSGETHLHKEIGPLFLSSQKGPVNTQDTSGNMVISSGLAAFHILDHKGLLEGQIDAGSLTARVKGSANVQLSSNTGPITVSVSRESQAHVLLTSKGQLNAPKVLEKTSGSETKLIQGQLEGTGQGSLGGRIRLKSESGDLNLKFL